MTSISSKEKERSIKFQLPSHFIDYLRTVHEYHKRTPKAPTTTIMSGSEPTLVWGSCPQTFRGAVAFWTLGMQFHPGGALGACRVLWSCAARVSPASPLPFVHLGCECVAGSDTILNTLLRCWALGQTLNRRRHQPRSEVRRAGAAEIPSPSPTLTNDHHHIHLTNQGDRRSGKEERDLLLFEHQLREGETERAARLQLEQMEFNHYLRITEMETRARLREREMGLRERQWRLRAQKIIFFSSLALFGAYVLLLFLRLWANNYVSGGEGGEGGEGIVWVDEVVEVVAGWVEGEVNGWYGEWVDLDV
ncbi:uncharacterized protein EAE97_006013 [Botrytis byssoidea]|uniref:Uncharacterized protein n=1 Tax=Botrytis byssoidea TaxID=139641 RepID=A0A9P5IPV8_9HELO|nr:uncharacterized protein EAE97_006013 [Botrytis byssoidea]KAF7942559.1 hypothetical protein EAE97_006013 [Botrytis byssoidea]